MIFCECFVLKIFIEMVNSSSKSETSSKSENLVITQAHATPVPIENRTQGTGAVSVASAFIFCIKLFYSTKFDKLRVNCSKMLSF